MNVSTLKPYTFIPGGEDLYWPGESKWKIVPMKFHYQQLGDVARDNAIKKSLADTARELEYYFETPVISYGGRKDFPRQALDSANGDFQYNMIHWVGSAAMMQISGSTTNLAYSRLLVRGIEIWMNYNMELWQIPQVLKHELTHCKFWLDHSHPSPDVSVMKVNYDGTMDKRELSIAREIYNTADLLAMFWKYRRYIEGNKIYLPGKYFVDNHNTMRMPLVRYPIGAEESEVEYFSVRYNWREGGQQLEHAEFWPNWQELMGQ